MEENYRPYLETVSSVLESSESSATGLSSEQAAERLEKYGPNKLVEAKKRSNILRFFDQMKDPMILILLAAAVLSFFTSLYQHENPADVFIILFVVVLNSVLGVVQESKAEEAIEALKQMTAARSKVLRDGEIMTLQSDELVPGDVIILEAGDSIPADGRIIEEASMKVEEAALTGESVPVTKQADEIVLGAEAKDVPLADRKNMVYMGSTVVYGRGKAVITGTGMTTEMGKIADAISQAEEEMTPLQIKLAQLSKILTKLVLGICVFIFALGVIKAGHLSMNVMEKLLSSIGLTMSSVSTLTMEQYLQLSQQLQKLPIGEQLIMMAPTFLLLLQIAVMVVSGAVANKLYYRKCIKSIKEVKENASEKMMTRSETSQSLYLSGGVNAILAGVFGLIYLFLMFT